MIEKEVFGMTDGYKVFLFTLKNSKGMTVKLTNYSGAVVNIFVPDKDGNIDDVVLGYDDLEGYVNGTSSQGALVGRYANRIAKAKFTLNGEEIQLRANEGTNCLHGGIIGYNKRVWTVDETTDDSVTFGWFSPDGEEDFPGNLKVTCKYTLTEDNELKLEYKGKSDADTIVNLTNHSYFNLGGIHSGSVLSQIVQINADSYTPVDSDLIPTGEIAPVEGTVFDFREPKAICRDLDQSDIIGYDHNFMLGEPHVMREAAVVYDPETGREMRVSTDKPAIQFYTAIGLQGEIGKGGLMMKIQTGLCLESQYAPDSPNQPNFPSCVLKAGEEYNFTTIYKFGVRK
jgi:aldose 1-epimerase